MENIKVYELYEKLWNIIKDGNGNDEVVISYEGEPIPEGHIRAGGRPVKRLYFINPGIDWEKGQVFLKFMSKKELEELKNTQEKYNKQYAIKRNK